MPLSGLVRLFTGFGRSTLNVLTDTFMSKTARLYQDTRTAASGMDKLNDDLQDVTRIMTKNMEELLWRGDSLDRAFLLTSCLVRFQHFDRNVAPVDVASLGIGKVQKSSAQSEH